MTPSFCHVAVEEALLCCLQPGNLMVRERKILLCSSFWKMLFQNICECLPCQRDLELNLSSWYPVSTQPRLSCRERSFSKRSFSPEQCPVLCFWNCWGLFFFIKKNALLSWAALLLFYRKLWSCFSPQLAVAFKCLNSYSHWKWASHQLREEPHFALSFILCWAAYPVNKLRVTEFVRG